MLIFTLKFPANESGTRRTFISIQTCKSTIAITPDNDGVLRDVDIEADTGAFEMPSDEGSIYLSWTRDTLQIVYIKTGCIVGEYNNVYHLEDVNYQDFKYLLRIWKSKVLAIHSM